MSIRFFGAAVAVSLVAISGAATGKDTASAPSALNNEDVGVPVFPYDITDRPYRVLGEVRAGVRKATIFSKAPDQRKVYGELWERAQKLGADAVVKANYGDPHVTAFSWGSVSATGLAVKFEQASPAPIAAEPTEAAPAQPAPSTQAQ